MNKLTYQFNDRVEYIFKGSFVPVFVAGQEGGQVEKIVALGDLIGAREVRTLPQVTVDELWEN